MSWRAGEGENTHFQVGIVKFAHIFIDHVVLLVHDLYNIYY